MIRLLAAAAVLLLGLSAHGAPISRWSSSPLDLVGPLQSGGREAVSVVARNAAGDWMRSADGGLTWRAVTVEGRRPNDVRVSVGDHLTWYAVVDQALYRTRDGGASWELRLASFGSQPAPIAGANPDVAYRQVFGEPSCGFLCTASPSRIFVSTDGGRAWRDAGITGVNQVAFPSPVDDRIVLATTFGALLRSDDRGATWRTVDLPVAFVGGRILRGSVTFDRRDSRLAYFRADQSTSSPGNDHLLSSNDAGASWTLTSAQAGPLEADPTSMGRVYLFGRDGRTLESRDAARSWAVVDAASANPGSVVALRGGKRVALGAGSLSLWSLGLSDGALALGSDLWWNPAESGAGLTITQHASNNPFVVWYTYDAAGAPVWRVVPGGVWNDRTFTGDLYETTGPAYFAGAFDPARVVSRKVGSATLRFDDENNAAFVYAMPGIATGEKRIARQQFAPPTPVSMDSVADLYWNPAESGWGIAINHQSSRIFAAWFAYGEDGKPLWIVMPDAPVVPQFAGAIVFPGAAGDIYTTRGPPEGTPYDPAKVVATRVGTARLSWFSQNSVYLEYTAFGRTETRIVRRQPF
jgi:photosystem II stability/assembly factor-like uncharacterized protein